MAAVIYVIEFALLVTFLVPAALLLVLNFEEKTTPA